VDGILARTWNFCKTWKLQPRKHAGFGSWFMYHCHILEHEDMDLMRLIVVVPSTVKNFVNDMMMMAGGEPDL
jgi:hypothetical protein